MKKAKHLAEAALLRVFFAAFRALPLDVASWTGGFIGRSVGPLLKAHKIADKNLSMVFPDMPVREKRRLLAAIWDNLGRTAAELPWLPTDALFDRMTIEGMEHLPADGRPVIFFSGHLGNWELTYPIAHRRGLPVTLIYRHANNPYVENIVAAIRATQSDAMLPKGPKGATRLGRAIKDGHSLAMLIDQKMNEGVAVPFFGREAMTAPAIADLSLRYGMKLIPARVVRLNGCRFRAMIYPPVDYIPVGDKRTDELAILTRINALLESWIREHPAQWFWVHKRWRES